jgi:hypothetical protein
MDQETVRTAPRPKPRGSSLHKFVIQEARDEKWCGSVACTMATLWRESMHTNTMHSCQHQRARAVPRLARIPRPPAGVVAHPWCCAGGIHRMGEGGFHQNQSSLGWSGEHVAGPGSWRLWRKQKPCGMQKKKGLVEVTCIKQAICPEEEGEREYKEGIPKSGKKIQAGDAGPRGTPDAIRNPTGLRKQSAFGPGCQPVAHPISPPGTECSGWRSGVVGRPTRH